MTFALLAMGLTVGGVHPAQGATIYILADGSGQQPTIQAGVNAAANGDTVLLADGTFTGVGNRNVRLFGKSIVLTSENGAALTIIDCQGIDRGFDITDSEGPGTVLSNITIRNGAESSGAGIHIVGSSPTITGVVISSCTATRGGGMNLSSGSSPALSGNILVGNSASEGGGIYLSFSSPTITNSTLVQNSATTAGGGIYARVSSAPSITQTIIAYTTQGEGITCSFTSNPTISCSNLFGNAEGDALCGVDGGGNFSADPQFCFPLGSEDVAIDAASQCAPANNSCALLIGASAVACGGLPNNAPVVANAIPDTTVIEDAAAINNYRDLNTVFSDVEDGGALSFIVRSNSNPTLVLATIGADSALDLSFVLNQNGAATLILRATDSGALFAEDTLVVTVSAVNDIPTIVSAIPDIAVGQNAPPINNYRDLNTVFADVEDGTLMTFTIQSNSNPSLVNVVIGADSALNFSFGAGLAGNAAIVVRATDSGGLFTEDSVAVSVTAASSVSLSTQRLFSPPIRPGDTPQPMFVLSLDNTSAFPETLTAITFTSTTTGPGTLSQLDANFSTMTLSTGNGAPMLPGGTPGPVASSFVAGMLQFSNLEVEVSAGTTTTLIVNGAAALNARDGDILDFLIADSTGVTFSSSVTVVATWPLDPADTFPVDGMVAQQITLHAVAATTFPTGTLRNLVMDFSLPSNGYEADTLNRLNIMNLGTATNGADISQFEAWIDDGDGVLNVTLDAALGAFSFTGSRWELTGLAAGIPLTGARLFVTVDIAPGASQTRTLQISLPTLPDVGVGMSSGNDGPIDTIVSNPFAQSVSSITSVVLSAPPISAGVVLPGGTDIELLHLIATNDYAAAKQVSRLTIRNATMSSGSASQSDLDGEITGLTLRIDANDNGILDNVATDPVGGAAFFNLGVATFSGLSWNVPAGASRHIFLTADLSLSGARDSDVLGATLDTPFDIEFTDPTTTTASWPLDSNPQQTIDGMLSTQITQFNITAETLAPGDGPILALDLVLPGNGYAADVLSGFEVVNLGTAGSTDISDLRIWRDGGDGNFSGGGGDDTDMGPMVWTGASWKSPVLSEALPVSGTCIFVGLTVSASPTDSTSVRLAVPVAGITVVSGNDGPIDAAIESSQSLLLSTAPLLATMTAFPPVSTVGQTVTVRMIARNVGSEQINNVAAPSLQVIGSAGLTMAANVQPPLFNLSPGAVDTFSWSYTATASGTAFWTGNIQGTGNVSGLLRTSLEAASNEHEVFDQAGNLTLFPIESMPFLISRGQNNVVPLSLTFSSSGASSASDARVLSVRLRIEDELGNGIVPADLLSQVILSEGNTTYITKSSLETTGSEIDLTLATPVVVPTVDQVTLSARFDILATTTVPSFRVIILDSTWIASEDAISGAPVTVNLGQGAYPVTSGLGRLVAAPIELDVKDVSPPLLRAGRGQGDVTLMTLQLDNPGLAGLTTDIAVAGIGISITDSTGVAITTPSQIFDRIRISGPLSTFVDRSLNAQDDSSIVFSLSPLAGVTTNTPLQLTIAGDVAPGALLGSYRVRLLDPTTWEARDSNTSFPLPVVYQTNPLEGGDIIVEAMAESLLVQGTVAFPAAVTVGERDVLTMTAWLQHPSAPGVGRIRIDEITVRFQNELRSTLVPGAFIDRLRVLSGGNEIANITNIPGTGDRMIVPTPGLLLEPATGMNFELRVDVAATAPQSFLELLIENTDIAAVDANTGASVVIVAQASGGLPVTSGLTHLLPPPTELEVSLGSLIPAALMKASSDIPAAALTMTNQASAGSGAITLEHLVVRAADRDFSAIPVGAFVTQVRAYVGGALIGTSDTLTVDSTTAYIPFTSPLVLNPQQPQVCELRIDTRSSIKVQNVRLGFDAADVGVKQPSSALLQIAVKPQAGSTFPMWTQTGAFSGLTLKSSFSNFPNPFAAGQENTTFVYYLPKAGTVSLKIWSARGYGVITIREDSPRAPGLYQDDIWSGHNGRGNVTLNGVYIAELIVQYDNGKQERLLRKVAVVR